MREYGELIETILRISRWIQQEGGQNQADFGERLDAYVEALFLAICEEYRLICADLQPPELGPQAQLGTAASELFNEMEQYYKQNGFDPNQDYFSRHGKGL